MSLSKKKKRENNEKKMSFQKEKENQIKEERLRISHEEAYRNQLRALVKERKRFEDQENQRKKQIDKQIFLEKREILRQENLKQKKEEMNDRNKMKEEINKIKINQAMKTLDDKFSKQKYDFDEKQRMLEEVKRKFELNKEENLNFQRFMNQIKEKELERIHRRNLEIEQEKGVKYNDKLLNIELRKKEKEELMRKSGNDKQIAQLLKEKKD